MSKNVFTSNQILPHKKLNPKYNRFEFSQEELNELKAAFQVFEDEEKGKITPRNIIKIFQSLGYDNNNENIMNMLQYLETNSVNGKIGFEEFLEGCNKYLGKNTPESDQLKIFRMFSESEENPVITYNSFNRMLINLGEEMSEEESLFIFQKNAGEKNYIDFNDFKRIFKRSSVQN